VHGDGERRRNITIDDDRVINLQRPLRLDQRIARKQFFWTDILPPKMPFGGFGITNNIPPPALPLFRLAMAIQTGFCATRYSCSL
jgi:hypothetical protein